EAVSVGEALQMVDDVHVRLETGLGRLLGVRLEVIDTADAVEDIEAEPAVIAQETSDLKQVRRRHHDKRVDRREVLCPDLVAELLFEDGDEFCRLHGTSPVAGITPSPASPVPCSSWRRRSPSRGYSTRRAASCSRCGRGSAPQVADPWSGPSSPVPCPESA